jgi:hypothetical protein
MTTRNIPSTFPIHHDDDHALHIGRLPDGRQFFLTTPFVPKLVTEPGCEFVALFYFDSSGTFLEAKINDFGPRALMNEKHRDKIFQERLAEISIGEFTDIEISSFEIEFHGVNFGFIPCKTNDENDECDEIAIEFHPGNYMAFFAPWDGEYYT